MLINTVVYNIDNWYYFDTKNFVITNITYKLALKYYINAHFIQRIAHYSYGFIEWEWPGGLQVENLMKIAKASDKYSLAFLCFFEVIE